jgi:predicted transcriptional regulator
MRKSSLKTYKAKPKHMNVRATEAMSFRTLPEIKKAIKEIAEKHDCSMTVVILKSLKNYFQLLEATESSEEDILAFSQRSGF